MDYKFCPECGTKLRLDARFCPNCGTKQPEMSKDEVDGQAETARPSHDQPAQEGQKQPSMTSNNSSSAQDEPLEVDWDDLKNQLERKRRSAARASQAYADREAGQSRQTTADFSQANFGSDSPSRSHNPESSQPYEQARDQGPQVDSSQFRQEQFRQEYDRQDNRNAYQQQGQAGYWRPYNQSARPGLNSSFSLWIHNFADNWSHYCMGRADFWYGYLAVIIINIVLEFIYGFTIGLMGYSVLDSDLALTGPFIVFMLIYIAISILCFSAYAARLHDTGHSAWNLLWILTGFGAIYVLILFCQRTNWNEQRWERPNE